VLALASEVALAGGEAVPLEEVEGLEVEDAQGVREDDTEGEAAEVGVPDVDGEGLTPGVSLPPTVLKVAVGEAQVVALGVAIEDAVPQREGVGPMREVDAAAVGVLPASCGDAEGEGEEKWEGVPPPAPPTPTGLSVNSAVALPLAEPPPAAAGGGGSDIEMEAIASFANSTALSMKPARGGRGVPAVQCIALGSRWLLCASCSVATKAISKKVVINAGGGRAALGVPDTVKAQFLPESSALKTAMAAPASIKVCLARALRKNASLVSDFAMSSPPMAVSAPPSLKNSPTSHMRRKRARESFSGSPNFFHA
jgi:hypothetical protein